MLDEKISALMDDEIDTAELDGCMESFSDSASARRAWSRQHLIRAVLKDQVTHTHMDLADKVMASLEAEKSNSVISGSARILRFPIPDWGKTRWAGGLALAASVAAVALLVPFTIDQSPANHSSSQLATAITPASGTQRVSNAGRARANEEARRELQRYLLDHESLASEHGLSGQRSYMRVASPSTAYVTYTPER